VLWLFGQTWIWILIAFILGLIIGYLISRFFGKKKQTEVTGERVAAPAGTPARERSLDDDFSGRTTVSADAKADADVTADAGVDTGSGLGLAAGGAAAGGAAGFLAGKSGDSDVDAPSVEADADTPALADGDRTEYIAAPEADAPSLDTSADVNAPSADVDAPSVDADAEKPAMSMIDDKDSGVDAGGAAAGAGGLGLAGAGAATLGSRDDTASADVDATSVDAETPSVDGGLQEAAYGPASALPLAGGAAPSAEFTVKGNEDSMLYHTADSPYYSRTKAEVWFKTPADAEAAGFTAWNKPKSGAAAPEAAAAPVVEPGAYPGSAKPLTGGAAPSAEYTVKGNEDSKLFHTPESAFYEHTTAEVWFKTPAEAAAAGFTPWNELRRTDAPAPASAAPAAAAAGAVGGGTVMGGSAVDTEPDTGRIPVQSAETATAPPSTDGQTASPYGPGSALPLAGGVAPSAEYTVKGNADSMLYHTTESPYFPRTVAEVWFKTPAEAEAAGFTAWNQRRGQEAVAAPTWEPGAYPNSAKPLADGAAPADEFTVKGNEDSMLFHTTESPYYPRTRAEVWFKTAADAEAAGFTAWNRRR
jgi:hypothetical protein